MVSVVETVSGPALINGVRYVVEIDDDGEDDSDWDFGKKVKGNKTNRSGSVVAVRKRDKGLL